MEFNPFSNDFFDDPYDMYQWLRDEAPVLPQRAYGFLGAVPLRGRRHRAPRLEDVHEHARPHPRPAHRSDNAVGPGADDHHDGPARRTTGCGSW